MSGDDLGARRKEHFIKYIIDRANESGIYNENLRRKIQAYADEIDYSFADLQLGGSKRRNKSKKSKKRNKSKKKRKTIY